MNDDDTIPCPDETPIQRVRFYSGQLLTTDDLAAEQSHVMGKQRMHNRLLHGHGVVCGFAVEPTDPPTTAVVVTAGVAIDCCGREIVLTEPVHLAVREPVGDRGRAGRVFITVAYGEMEIEPVPGPGDGHDLESTRVREVPRIHVDAEPPPSDPPSHGGGRIRPCPPCDDPRVVLATIDLSRSGAIGERQIDCTARRSIGEGTGAPGGVATPDRRCPPVREALGAAGALGLVGWWVARRRR